MSIAGRLANFAHGGGFGDPDNTAAEEQRAARYRHGITDSVHLNSDQFQRAPEPSGEVGWLAGRAIGQQHRKLFGHGQGPLGHEPEQRSPWVVRMDKR